QKNDEYCLLIMGFPGSGKKATANSILLKHSFNSTPCTVSLPYIKCSRYDGNHVTIVNGLVLSTDTNKMNEYADKFKEALSQHSGGYHAVVWTIPLGFRFIEAVPLVQHIEKNFGKYFLQNFCILAITYADYFDLSETKCDTIEDWCRNQEGEFKTLVDECQGRLVYFDNRTKDHNEKIHQKECVFRMIDKMLTQNCKLKYNKKNVSTP
ncbi:GTPase IMAP family member 7, partial [Biomphalaria glabrata]